MSHDLSEIISICCFGDQETLLIKFKAVQLLNIFVEMMIYVSTGLIDEYKLLFEIEILRNNVEVYCCNYNVITVTCDKFILSLLNKSIHFLLTYWP